MNADDKMIEKVYALMDGELPESERTEVEQYLKSHPEVQNKLHDWENLSTVFFRSHEPKPSNQFVDQVMAKLDLGETSETSSSPIFGGFFRWFVPTAGFAFAAMALFFTFPGANNAMTTEDLLYSNSPIQTISTIDEEQPEDPGIDELLAI